jgi:alpha-glucosidase
MHQAFNFDYLLARWSANEFRAIIDTSLAAMGAVGAPATWVTSNHDTVRYASRLGLGRPGDRPNGIDALSEQPDEKLGLRRARAAAFLTLALPGSAYLFQGEELGLPEHTTIEAQHRQDPTFHRTGGGEIGRDGSRVPMPWCAQAPSFGFGPSQNAWLPQPECYARYAADQQDGVPGSTLELYRELLRLRRAHGLGGGSLCWQSSADSTLVFDNGTVRAAINLGDEDAILPAGEPLASSQPLRRSGTLPGNTAAWLALP